MRATCAVTMNNELLARAADDGSLVEEYNDLLGDLGPDDRRSDLRRHLATCAQWQGCPLR